MSDKNKAGMGAGEVYPTLADIEQMAREAQPCPFCGGPAGILTHNAPRFGCLKPLCRGGRHDDWGNMPDAIRAWNKRTLARQLSEAQVPDGWVPVSERLPELEQPVALLNAERFENCHFDRNIQAAGYLDNFGGRSRPYWSVRGEPALEISAFTHWLALPSALPAQPQERGAESDAVCPSCQSAPCRCDDLIRQFTTPADQSAPAAGESEGKPSWEDAPEWAQWLAQDSRGVWRWYAAEPSQGRDSLWFAPLENARETYAFRPNPNWRNTLEQRPAQAGEEESDAN